MPEKQQSPGKNKNEKEVYGIRRERTFFWNTASHKWDELKEKIWLKDKRGKETPYREAKKGA